MSKMKALENGQKKTGIYRNFYKSIENHTLKSQSKSSDFITSKKLYGSIEGTSNELFWIKNDELFVFLFCLKFDKLLKNMDH